MKILEFYLPISEGIFFEKINCISEIDLKIKVKSITQARSDKYVYRVLGNDNNLYRFDFGKRYMCNSEEQSIASQYVNIPKLISFLPNKRCKISQWIDGSDLTHFANIPEVLIKSGELMAKLNLIKRPNSDSFLSNCEFSDTNAIWTGGEVWLIDPGKLRWTKNISETIAQVLIKRMRFMSRINLFLEGYIKHNSKEYNSIISICENMSWKWGKKTVIINENLKNHI